MEFLQDATEPKYLICNADEGDPGALVNRILMESDPHPVIEGMLIGATPPARRTAGSTSATSTRWPSSAWSARCRRPRQGMLGENVLGTGVKFDCEVVRGAGTYVCGDESGLIASLNDERGMPQIKPPFPAQTGVLGKPTNVNNVETYACVDAAARRRRSTAPSARSEPRHEDLHRFRRRARSRAASKCPSA